MITFQSVMQKPCNVYIVMSHVWMEVSRYNSSLSMRRNESCLSSLCIIENSCGQARGAGGCSMVETVLDQFDTNHCFTPTQLRAEETVKLTGGLHGLKRVKYYLATITMPSNKAKFTEVVYLLQFVLTIPDCYPCYYRKSFLHSTLAKALSAFQDVSTITQSDNFTSITRNE